MRAGVRVTGARGNMRKSCGGISPVRSTGTLARLGGDAGADTRPSSQASAYQVGIVGAVGSNRLSGTIVDLLDTAAMTRAAWLGRGGVQSRANACSVDLRHVLRGSAAGIEEGMQYKTPSRLRHIQ